MTPTRQKPFVSLPTRRILAFLSLAALFLSVLTPGNTSFARPAAFSIDPSEPNPAGEAGAPRTASTPAAPNLWVVRAYYSDPQMVRDLARWLEPWEVHPDEGYLVVGVTPSEYELLQKLGFRVEVDQNLTAQVNRPRLALPSQTSGIPGFPCYRTVEETYASAQAMVAAHPDLASWLDIGDSWEKTQNQAQGYDLNVLRLTNTAITVPKPKLFIMSSVHAREYTPAELTTRFAEYLLAQYNIDPDVTWLLDYHDIQLLLQANPDGRKHAERGEYWRKNTNANYCPTIPQLRGADLNRNFSFQWGLGVGSSSDPCSTIYRGPGPASEPETQAIQDYVRGQFPDQRQDALDASAPITATGVFMDLHSYSPLVIWPWGFTNQPPPNGTALQTLGRKFAYFNDYPPTQASGLYPTDGTTDDFAYGELGLAAYTFEIGTAFFQDCQTFENTILPDNLPALLYAAKVARTPYQTPAGPDALNLTANPSSATPGEMVVLNTLVNDTRYNNQNGHEPVQKILAAEYYIDVPPWITSTVPISNSMDFADGVYDSSIEQFTANLDTTGLSLGRHIIYVRGQDGAGNWGAVSAVFIDIHSALTLKIFFPIVVKN